MRLHNILGIVVSRANIPRQWQTDFNLFSHRTNVMTDDAHKKSPSGIGYRNQSGVVSDARLHEEIMSGVDDTASRTRSAKRAAKKIDLTPEQALKVFGVAEVETTDKPRTTLPARR